MDRPKHRRFFFLGIALLAGGTLLLLGRQRAPSSEPPALSAKEPTAQQTMPKIDRAEPIIPADATASAASTRAAAPTQKATTGLRGQVVDAVTRQPVNEFTVMLARIERAGIGATRHEPITRKFTSQTGRFTWDLDAGYWHAAVQGPGYQQFDLGEREFLADKSTPELVVPLLRGNALRGRVFDQSTGAGLPDAGVGFREAGTDDDSRGLPAFVRSQGDGSFTLDGVPAGDIVLTVGASGYAYRELELAVDEETQPIEIALSVGGTIAGVVKTLSGAPVKGDIFLEGSTNYFGGSDENGRFSYTHMRPGRYTVSAQTGAGSALQDFVLGQDERKDDIVLIVGGGRSVRGIIAGLRPEQLSHAYLLLRPESTRELFSARPDAQGAYVLNGVPPGRAVISVRGGGREFDKPVDVPADRDAALDIVFPAGARLSGRITRGGQSAANNSVWMQLADDRSGILYRASSSADGQYEIEGLPPGEYRLRADEDISRLITVAGDAVLNIDIPSVQLAVRVVEDGGAVPVVGANAYVRGSEPETARVRGDKQTDDFGEFRLTGIEPGDIMLLIYKPGYELHREKLAYSAPITKTITLRKSAGVDVRVKPGSRRFPRGFTLTQYIPNNDYQIDLWMPLDREGLCHVPAALAGTSFHVGRFSGKPIVFEEWDGQSFELP
jgi:hypothetical protein